MYVVSILALIVVGALFFIILPIATASQMELKSKNIVIVLSLLNIVIPFIAGLVAHIIMLSDMKREGYFTVSDNSRVQELRRKENEKYFHHVILYVVEFGIMFMPLIKVNPGIALIGRIAGLKESYNLFALKDSLFDMNALVYIYCGILLFGALMNIFVQNPKKTIFFDSAIQFVYLFMSYIIIKECKEYYSGEVLIAGMGNWFIILVSVIFMIMLFMEITDVTPQSYMKTLSTPANTNLFKENTTSNEI